MKRIAYIVPYFGKLPDEFDTWLLTCKYNPDVNWILFLDDREATKYPSNVEVYYTTFEDFRDKLQSIFDFKIELSNPYQLCDFRPAYGEVFFDLLSDYDFWGYCDVDLMWGNIRKFITDDVLDRYDKIGFQGHSTLFRNTSENSVRYRLPMNGKSPYTEAFTKEGNSFFDEEGITKIYRYYNFPSFEKTIFANISPLTWSFYLRYMPQDDDYKNNHQIFTWEEGCLKRLYVDEDAIDEEEYMYIHFLKRKMKVKLTQDKGAAIYPNVIEDLPDNIDVRYIKKKGKNNMLKYYVDLAWRKRNKISPSKIINYFSFRHKSIEKRRTSSESKYE